MVENRVCWKVEELVYLRDWMSLCNIGLVMGRWILECFWWFNVVNNFCIKKDLVGL